MFPCSFNYKQRQRFHHQIEIDESNQNCNVINSKSTYFDDDHDSWSWPSSSLLLFSLYPLWNIASLKLFYYCYYCQCCCVIILWKLRSQNGKWKRGRNERKNRKWKLFQCCKKSEKKKNRKLSFLLPFFFFHFSFHTFIDFSVPFQ